MREELQDEAQSSQDQLDGAVQTQAQKGFARGGEEEEVSQNNQVPARYSRCHPQ